MHETGREGGEILFASFVRAVEKIQRQTFWTTSKGKLVARVSGGGGGSSGGGKKKHGH